MNKLNGEAGTYAANEGIWIAADRQGVEGGRDFSLREPYAKDFRELELSG